MPQMLTILEVVQRSATFLESKGVPNARLDAEWLIASALGLDRMKLYMQFDRPLAEDQLAVMRSKVARRAKREPLQYILGTTPFHELNLKIDHRALIPRPETEQLVEWIMGDFEDNAGAYRILDLGTGSGAIALGLAFHLPRAQIVAVDRSADALELAQENAFHCGMQSRVVFRESDWFEKIHESDFDLIVANPPYLTKEELASSEPEVREFEPRATLVASDDGLEDLELIVRGAFDRLKPGGRLWLETGIGHRDRLLELCKQCGYRSAEGLDDWSERPRFARATR